MDPHDRRQITRALHRAGFSIDRRTTHTERWVHRDGRTFSMPAPGGHDSRKATDQRKALRALGVPL